MADPFRPNTKSRLFREAQIGLTVLALLLALLVYVAFYRITGRGKRLPDHVLNAPIAQSVSPEAKWNQQVASLQQNNLGLQNSPVSRFSPTFLNQDSGSKSDSSTFTKARNNFATNSIPNVANTDFKSKPLANESFKQRNDFVLPKVTLPESNTARTKPTNPFADPLVVTPVIEKVAESVRLASAEKDFGPVATVPSKTLKPKSNLSESGESENFNSFAPLPTESAISDLPISNSNLSPFKIPKSPQPKADSKFGSEQSASANSLQVNELRDGTSVGSSVGSSFKVQVVPEPDSKFEKPAAKLNPSPKSELQPGPEPEPMGLKSPLSFSPPLNSPSSLSSQTSLSSSSSKKSVTMVSPKPTYAAQAKMSTSASGAPITFTTQVTPAAVAPPALITKQELNKQELNKQDDVPGVVFRPAANVESQELVQRGLEQASKLNQQQPTWPSSDRRSPVHVAKQGDSFWSIAQTVYSDGNYFRALYRYNETLVDSFESVPVGTEIQTPSSVELRTAYPKLCPQMEEGQGTLPSQRGESQVYITRHGDTLFGIARQQLGQASRYREIHKLNHSRLPASHSHLAPMAKGVELVLPAE